MTKTKNVQDFSPAATRIYQAAKRGITLRTNPSHVKRIIDKELDKHSLSKEKIKKEISDVITKTITKAVETEVKKTEKFLYNQIEELEEQVVGLKKDLEVSIPESEKKYLVEDKEVLIAQLENLKTRPPNGPIEDAPIAMDQEKKPAEGKKK